VWVGYPGEVELSMQPPRTPIRVTGGSWPAQIFQRFMSRALAGTPVEDFVAPPTTTTTAPPSTTTTLAVATTGAPQIVPNVLGQPRDSAIAILQSRGYRVAVAERASEGTPGVVLAQAPAADSQLGTGGVVSIEVSVPRSAGNRGNGNGNGGGRGDG
jgi:penicillin-binding protein 1A